MKKTFISRSLLNQSRGFTLIELLVVIAIIALLAAMTFGAFSYAQNAAMRNRTTAVHRAIVSGLERYNSEFGEYPEPSAAGPTRTINGRPYDTGGALMLYQALSGDGSDRIKIELRGPGSDGRWDTGEKMLMSEMPREIYTNNQLCPPERRKEKNGDMNCFMLLDGFGHPFQYTKGGTTDAINPTFDLWSYGEDEANTNAVSRAQKQDPSRSAKWIKNF
jgi:prepilin-type N-terminal cleavage/methylation domain-containing protein